MKQLSFLNDSFIVRALKKLKSYADDSLFFHFDFSVHHAKEHQKPYRTQVSTGLFYKITRGIDGIFGKIEGFLAKSAKNSVIGSKLLEGLEESQKEALASVSSLTFGFGLVMAMLSTHKKLGAGLMVLSVLGSILSHLLKDRIQYSWIYKGYHKLFKAGDE